MVEVQDTAQSGQEPSMEEILASIRRIIADPVPGPAAAEAAPATDDVIELTQMVQDDGSVVEIKPEEIVSPETSPMPEPVAVNPEPMPAIEAALQPVVKEQLVSPDVASTTASSLTALASTVEIDRLASMPQTHTFLGNGGRTLEDMTLELMRPLLKQWLDQNLPGIVDRLVQKEIERIARRS
jgi:cell pole-organizing protein PopZ